MRLYLECLKGDSIMEGKSKTKKNLVGYIQGLASLVTECKSL